MKIIELNDSPYENGKKIGHVFYAYLNRIQNTYIDKLDDTLVYDQVRTGRMIIENEMPELLEELYGKAEGAGIRKEVILLMAMPEILRKKSGCTTIIRRKENGTIAFSHNEDEWYKEFNPESTALLKYQMKDKIIYGYTNACRTIGSCFGFRSDGLLISCNNLMSDETDLSCGSRYFLAAKLYFSDSYDDAVNCVINMKPASSFHVNLVDTVSNRACSIERDIHDYTLTPLDDVLVHSNHFLHKTGKTDTDTLFRYQKTCELLKETDDIKEILSYSSHDPDHTIHMSDPENKGLPVTAANMTYDPFQHAVTIADYINDEELVLPVMKR